MRKAALALSVLALAACSKTDDTPSADTVSAVPVAPAAEAPGNIAAADLAGTWTVNATKEGTDSVLTTYELTATADSMWMMKFPNLKDPVHVHVKHVAADSIVLETDPYSSALRPGVKVRTTSVLRMQDGRIVGSSVARYDVKTADSVLRITTTGTRK